MSEARQKEKNSNAGINKYFKRLDIFGLPVTLVHEGDRFYRTEVGSVFTLILLVAVLTFFSMKIQTLVKQDTQ